MSKRTWLVASLALAVCMGGRVGSAFADLAVANEAENRLMLDSNSVGSPELPGDYVGAPRAASCGTVTITQNTDDTTITAGNSVACGNGTYTTEHAYARCFVAPAGGFLLECVDVGIQTNSGPITADLAVTVGAPGLCATVTTRAWPAPAPTLLTTIALPVVATPPGLIATHNLAAPIAVAAGNEILVEFHHANRDPAGGGDGFGLWIGSNTAGETPAGSGYITAMGNCGLANYSSFDSVGFPAVDLIMRLGGQLLTTTGACCTDTPFPGSCVEGVLQSACLGPNQRFLAGAGQCGNFVPACGDAPANDDCLNKEVLVQQSECVAFDNTIATDDAVFDGNCPSGTFTKDLWYTYTVPNTVPASTGGTLVISTIGSTFDTLLSVYDMSFQTQGDVCGGAGFSAACNDDIDTTFNPLSYIVVNSVVPGNVYKIRVGGNGPGQFGAGMLNIDYLPTTDATGLAWAGFTGVGGVGRCCFADGSPCQITNQDNQGFLTGPACVQLGGYFRGETDFWEGIDGAPGEFSAIGCCTVPCPDLGEACYNGIDLNIGANAKLGAGATEGTVGRAISDKLYYKYALPAAGTSLVFDTCNSDFDTVIEIYGGCAQADSRPTPLLSSGGHLLVNDDCNYGDADETATGTKLANNCLAVSGEVDSCLCLTVEAPGAGNGLSPGDTIIICIGGFNADRALTGVNSVDPVRDPLSATMVSAVLNVTAVAECFVCEVDETGANSDESLFENNCASLASDRANDGCSLPGVPATHDLNLDGMPTVPFGTPWKIWGRTGVYIDSVYGQRADEDWYEFDVTEKVTIDVELVAAEFVSDIRLYRKGDVDACQTDFVNGFLINVPCFTWVAGMMQADICPGSYYLVIKPQVPAKPDCASVPEYLAQITLSVAGANTCCKGDVNGDGKVDGLDIQDWVDYFLNPPGVSGNLNTWDVCSDREYCAVDADDDGSLTMADLGAFVALLLSPPTCDPLSANCDDPQACQSPDQSGQTTSDKNPSVNGGAVALNIRTADNFMANETGDITDLCWWGYGWDGAAGFADCGGTMAMNFTATYWTSQTTAGGLPCPNTLLAGPLAIGGVTRVNNGTVNVFGDVEYKFTGTHAPVGVVAGECYWIEIANDTTGTDCFFLWSYSGDGDGVIAQHIGAGDPTTYSCDTELFAGDMAFCVDVRIAPNGCAGEPLVGACCLVDGSTCVMVTSVECQLLYNWLSWDPAAVCGVDCCDAPLCTVSCQPGDVSETEGCGYHKNDGCNTSTTAPPMEALGLIGAPGSVTACGETFSDFPSGGDFDGDWWSFSTSATGLVSFTFETESSFDFYLLDQSTLDCANVSASLVDLIGDGSGIGAFIVTPPRCESTTVFELVLPVGNYIAVLEGSSTETNLCGDFPNTHYRMTIDAGAGTTVDLVPNCPVGGVSETDPDCGVTPPDENGGCNEVPEVFDTVACNTTVCGTVAFDGTTRDIDWFLFTVPGVAGESQWVTLTFQAEFDLLVAVGSTPYIDCNNDGTTWLLQKSKYDPDPLTLTQCLAPGTYLALVTIQFPNDASTTICGVDPGSFYTMTLDCGGPCSCGETADSCQGPGMASVVVSDVDAGQVLADDFRPTLNTINSICWWGVSDDVATPGFQDCSSPVADNFIVTFYGDNGAAAPDTANVLGTYTLSGAGLTKINTGETFNTAVLYQYSNVTPLGLDVSAAVGAGKCVWVEITQDNSDCGCTWSWATSAVGNTWMAFHDGTGVFASVTGADLAFCVDNPFGAACPIAGACCDDVQNCVGTMIEADCLALPNHFWTPNETCDTFVCPPPNAGDLPADTCANAEAGLANVGGTAFVNFTISGAGLTATAPPTSTCEIANGGPFAHDADAWWLFTASHTTATITMCGLVDTEDSVMTLFTTGSTCAAPTELFCDDDFCTAPGFGTPQISATGLVPGSTYLLVVDFYSGGHTDGPHQLTITSP